MLTVFACAALVARSAAAQLLTAPTVVSRPDAVYPAAALRDRVDASVGLELDVDVQGHVTGARVTKPAGRGFDESALAAAKQIVFVPAKRDGVAIPATIDFTYEFHPPPVAPKPKPKPEVVQTGEDQSTVVLAHRPISAASSFSVRDRDFQLRPIGSVQDILRVTPGLVLVQHSGGGKANQYFLRGFDADHGTDIAFSIDGVPINMPSHAHGQGYSDTNFIIPEVVEHVQVTKGPYFANQGDFATAGAINLVSRDAFEHSSIGIGFGGSPGQGAPSYRALLVASPRIADNLRATFALDVGRANGPFDNPENWDKLKLFNKLTWAPTPTQTIKLTEMSYEGNWHGSGQIPERAVAMGLSRFGSIDPDEGGGSARHQIALEYKLRPNEKSELSALAYAGTYRFDLFSNFTLYERDPENGDEIEQVDNRTFYGGKLSYRVVNTFHGVRFDTTIGGDVRSDDIHEELWDTLHREELSAVKSDDVHETLLGAYANEEISPWKWLRLSIGGRADALEFQVADKLGNGSGTSGATQLSPKLAAVVTALDRKNAELEMYLDYGHGFHSNDVRGAFGPLPVTPLTRAVGEEVGMRARFWKRFDLAASLWMLDLASETVWNGDDGTTVPSDPTNRYGLEVESRLEITKWLAADLDVTVTHSAFTVNHGNAGGALALAPKQTWSGGLSVRHPLGPGMIRAGLRFFGIGERPASDDGVITVPGWTEFDLHVGYRHRRFDVALDIENLFDQQFYSAAFDTVSRLRNDPAIGAPIPPGFTCGANARLAAGPAANRFYGCEGLDFTPAYPFSARLTGTFFFD
ncbi:MAG TPA: TonB-dependent receptor [Polyangiaceae bacterium]